MLTVALAMLTIFVVTGSFGDKSAEGKFLYIVQSALQRTDSELTSVAQYRQLLPVTSETLAEETVLLSGNFSVTATNENDNENYVAAVDLAYHAQMYKEANVLDHIVVVTNAGNVDGYVRTWLAFEMGDLTEEEFAASLSLNCNKSQWTWGEFTYGVTIEDERFAVVCAKYNEILPAGATTPPSLLQILLNSETTSEIAARLDASSVGEYKIYAYSQATSDNGAWSGVGKPWNLE